MVPEQSPLHLMAYLAGTLTLMVTLEPLLTLQLAVSGPAPDMEMLHPPEAEMVTPLSVLQSPALVI